MPDENANPVSVSLDMAGLVQGSADEKGRVKLPALIKKHLEESGETEFFVTTFDVRTVRIYTREAWMRNAAILDKATTKAARSVLFISKVYGSRASLDKQGRILLNPQLRKKLEIGNEPVWFERSKEHLKVYSKKVYDEQLVEATADLELKNQEVEELGIG